jgi:hypothetical protein
MSPEITRATKVVSVVIVTAAVIGAAALLAVILVRRHDYPGEFTATLNQYLGARRACLWPKAIQLPVQADAVDPAQTAGFNALVDAGLLQRTTSVEERHRKSSTVEYSLSDMGNVNWTRDGTRPDYGNFCFGHMQVSSLVGYQRVGSNPATYQVTYRDSVMLLPWAEVPEVQQAFPILQRLGNGEADSATLVESDNGWRVESTTSAGQVLP